MDRDGGQRLQIAARLEALAREFRGGSARAAELDQASDDEMFDLIDKELGLSG